MSEYAVPVLLFQPRRATTEDEERQIDEWLDKRQLFQHANASFPERFFKITQASRTYFNPSEGCGPFSVAVTLQPMIKTERRVLAKGGPAEGPTETVSELIPDPGAFGNAFAVDAAEFFEGFREVSPP